MKKIFIMLLLVLPFAVWAGINDDLINAVFNGDKEAVASLIAKGANVNAKDKDGYTPLIWASQYSKIEMVNLLLVKGADVNAKTNNGNTALIIASHEGRTEIIRFLLEKGADVNAKDNDGFTPLIWVSAYGYKEK